MLKAPSMCPMCPYHYIKLSGKSFSLSRKRTVLDNFIDVPRDSIIFKGSTRQDIHSLHLEYYHTFNSLHLDYYHTLVHFI